ncbi:hypothetical protein ACWGOE_07410 [Leucobacter chromiiresistens]
MPITAVQEAAPTRPRMSAYARAELVWVALAIVIVFAYPAALLQPANAIEFALMLLVVTPAPFFALLRIIAAVADANAGA